MVMNDAFRQVPNRVDLVFEPAQQRAAKAMLREAVLRRELAYLLQERDALRTERDALHADLAKTQSGCENFHTERYKRKKKKKKKKNLWRRIMRTLSGRKAGGGNPAVAGDAVPLISPMSPPAGNGPDSGRYHGRKILIAADMPPLFDQHSGALRLKTIITLMGEAGWSITFCSLIERDALPGVLASPQGRKHYEEVLAGCGVKQILYGSVEIDGFLGEVRRSLDWAFLSFPHVATELMPLVRSRCPTTRIAFDMVDFHGLRLSREAVLRTDAKLAQEAARQQALEIACAQAADVTFAVTTDEQAALLDLVPQAVVEVLPNAFDLPPDPPPGPAGREGLFFLGGFWHQPNGDAATWFVERILPLIQQEAPDATLTIAGSNPGNEVLALGVRPDVEVLGFVPDLAPLFDRHRVFVAPLRYGAGMKGKVGQSMAYGLPVVATAIGAEGMNLKDGIHFLMAPDEEAFAAQVLRLMQDDELWSRLAAEGRSHVGRTLSVECMRRRLEMAFDG